MFEWILKYWLEALFGVLCAGISVFFKHYYKKIADRRKFKQDQLNKSLDEKFENQQKDLQKQMKACYTELSASIQERDERLLKADEEIHRDIGVLRGGLLSVQGREFKADCRYLLTEGHKITVDEYQNIVEEYRVYKSLEGNHEGDALFKMVQAKYEHSLNLEIAQ